MPRPTKYSEEIVSGITEALTQGDSRKTACKKAGIDQRTFERWMSSIADFAAAVKNAEDDYRDWEHNGIIQSARKSLKVLIEGQEYEEVKTEYEQDPTDPDAPRIKKQTRTTKKILPNATAVIFALVNRDPEHWQNRINGELTQKVEVEEKPNISLANVPDELLGQLINAINGK